MAIFSIAFFNPCAYINSKKFFVKCQISHTKNKMKWIVEHEIFGPVIMDTEKQTYTHLDWNNFKWINGCRYLENMTLFEEAKCSKSIVPFVCTAFKKSGKRTVTTLMDWNNRIFNFYNVELIKNKWTRNCVDGLISGKCYLIVLERNTLAVNNAIILQFKELKKE